LEESCVAAVEVPDDSAAARPIALFTGMDEVLSWMGVDPMDAVLPMSSTRDAWYTKQRFETRISALASANPTREESCLSRLPSPAAQSNRAAAYLKQIATRFASATTPLLLSVQQTPGKSYSLLTSRSADMAYSATLSNFIDFFGMWTGKAVGRVQDCLLASLTDKDPLAERVSIIEAWLLWTGKHCSGPDAFQHACVHLKYYPPPPPAPPLHSVCCVFLVSEQPSFINRYALRGAAMIHCLDHLLAKRWHSWCM
jgi:hypothetical protein